MASQGTYTLKAPAVRNDGAGSRIASRLASRIGRRLAAALKQVQYGRQMQALSQLSDGQLAEIGLRRSEIPAYAWRLIHESG
ncbi:MAG TPA: DUF1127 domain-containing protein [Thermohalobaculum sp.]|nr:DUF1127 domain-containing protein [Thermohalobaculum sp.]